MDIMDIKNPWRADVQPARFKNAPFHCEVGSRESGRRIVEHEFPKKELPFAEDMGRQAIQFTVRGYCIAYPRNMEGAGLELYNRDYRIARDLLRRSLEEEGSGDLQLPFQKSLRVVCTKYRLSEEERFGGYCVFDMTFVEVGMDPQQQTSKDDTQGQLGAAADNTRNAVSNNLSPSKPPPVQSPVDVREA